MALLAGGPPARAAPGEIATVAGDGSLSSAGDGGQATAAGTGSPEGVFSFPGGFLLNEDVGPRVRSVDSSGSISTMAGGGPDDPGDGGPATQAMLQDPEQVIRARDGAIYFTSGHRVRRVSQLGIVTTVAGTGTGGYSGDGGAATAAQLNRPHGLALDLDGNLYVADCDNNRVRRVGPLGVITTVAGTGVAGYSGDGGPATSAQLNCPVDVAVDAWGRIFVADDLNHVVRTIDQSGDISGFAGTGTAGYSGDGGPATSAQLNQPQGLEVDGARSVYIADTTNHVIRKVDSAGTVTTVAGTGAGAGTTTGAFSGDGGPATLAELSGPRDVSFDRASGDFYIADRYNNRIRRVEALGAPAVLPTTQIDSAPASPGADPTPTWEVSTSSTQQVSFECRLLRGAAVVADWAPCSSSRTYDLTAEPGGSYTFQARAVTVSGVGTPASSSYAYETLDHFDLDPVGEQTSGRPFDVTIRAKTASGLPVTSFNGTVGLSVASGTISPSASGPFVNGVLTGQVTITSPYAAAETITATGPTPDKTGTSAPFELHDRKYYFKQTTAETGSGCGGAFAKRDMQEGYSGQDPEATFRRLSSGSETINFCSPAFGAAATLPAAAATVHAYVENTHGNSCAISATLLEDGSTALGSASRSISARTPLTEVTWTINAGAISLSPGERLNLRFEMAGVKACTQTTIHYGGTTNRSHLDLMSGSLAPSIGSGPGPTGSDRTPAWSFAGEAGASFECRLEQGSAPVAGHDWTACTSPKAYDLAALPDATYSFAVRQTDGAGRTSPPATSDYTLDSAAPAAPTIDAAPPSPSSDPSVSWDFSGEDGAVFECRLFKGATVVSGFGPCPGSQGYTLSAGDGTYTFEVRQTDAAGNTGPAAARGYELDTGVPSPPMIGSEPASPGSDRAPSWSVSGEPSALLECRLTRGATVVSDWGGCLSPKTYDLTGAPDGTYTFSTRQTDTAGNTSAAANSAYALDTAAPSVPSIDSAPPSPGNDRTPGWSFSGEPGATLECRLDRGASAVSGWSACSSPRGFDLSGEPDGAYTFSVRQTDAAGNASPPATSEYSMDTTAPADPAITSSPGAEGRATNPAWSFTEAPGTISQCRLTRDATVVSDWSACASPRSFDLSALPDGRYTFSVRAADDAGNTSTAVSDQYVLDRLPPGAPTLTGSPPPVANDQTPTWSFTGEAQAVLECRLERGPQVVEDWTVCTSPATYDVSGSADGDHRFLVRARDRAGNVSSPAESSYELDRTPPAAAVIESGPGALGSSRTPAWTFTGDADATYECRLTRGSEAVADWAPCSGATAYDLAGQPDGDYVLSVVGRDEVGNVGPQTTSAYRLDTAGADVTIESGPGPLGNSASPTWTFSGEQGARFDCRLERAGAPEPDWGACSSPRTFDLSSAPDGRYTFAVRSHDAAGNIGETSLYAYELDRVAPDAPEFTQTPGPLGNDATPRWEFTAEAGAVTECALARAGEALGAWAPCAGARSYDLSRHGDGSYAVLVRASDAAGNVGRPAESAYRLDATAPDAPQITHGPGVQGRERRVSWAFTSEPGASLECRLAGDSAILDRWAACASPSRFELTADATGRAFHVRARDEAGNLGPAARSDYTLLPESGGGRDEADEGRQTGEGDGRDEQDEGRQTDGGDGRDERDEGRQTDEGDGRRAVDRSPTDGGSPPTGSAGSTPPPAGPAGSSPPPAESPAAPASSERQRSAREGGGRPDGDRKPARRRRPALDEPAWSRGAADAPTQDRAARPAPSDSSSRGERLLQALKAAADWVGKNLDKTGFPLLLLLLVVAYLAGQNRFDRADPKLALAPVHADRNLEFTAPPSLRSRRDATATPAR